MSRTGGFPKKRLYSRLNWLGLKQLGSLFRSIEELELTLRIRVAKAFDIPVENVTDFDG
jgi:hypothetical protein